jgi:hypothetical protein
MINEIMETLSPSYFPTSQFGTTDFSNKNFKQLKYLFDEIASGLTTVLPIGRYKVKKHVGEGGIANAPWIGIRSSKGDDQFDSSPNFGLYLAIIWRVDGKGIYLSFQKGTDGIKGKKKEEKILTYVDLIRSEYGTFGFEKSMDLKWQGLKTPTRPKNYENAHIAGRLYFKNDLSKLPEDIEIIERLYDAVINDNPTISLDVEGDGKVLVKESFEPTYDRETLEERADDLLSFGERKPAQGNPNPGQRTVETVQHERDPGVRADVLDRANGKCELCNKDAPFHKANGKPFLEVHHAIPLGEGGPDTVENAFALCPNCHREAHYGANKDSIRQMLENGQRKPKRKHGGLGQIIAEFGGNKFE